MIMAYDLLIKNARIIDGSGGPSLEGSVAVQDGRIQSVGKVGGSAHRVIDAQGLAVAPGFIDNHCHYDAQVTWDPLCTFSCYHGATSVVIGNCSLSLAPVRDEDHYALAQMLSRVEAIPIESLEGGNQLVVEHGAGVHGGIEWQPRRQRGRPGRPLRRPTLRHG